MFFAFRKASTRTSVYPRLNHSTLSTMRLVSINMGCVHRRVVSRTEVRCTVASANKSTPGMIRSETRMLCTVHTPGVARMGRLCGHMYGVTENTTLVARAAMRVHRMTTCSGLVSDGVLTSRVGTCLRGLNPVACARRRCTCTRGFRRSLSSRSGGRLPAVTQSCFNPGTTRMVGGPVFRPVTCRGLCDSLGCSASINSMD